MKGKFPNGLKSAMLRMALGPTELARLADTSKQNIQRWADGERKLPIEWAERLAPILKVTPESLFFPPDLGGFRTDEEERFLEFLRKLTPDERDRAWVMLNAAFTTPAKPHTKTGTF
jgi:hypothetical protein